MWNGAPRSEYSIVPCDDGFVAADCAPAVAAATRKSGTSASRADIIRELEGLGIAACAVRTLNEIAADKAVVGSGAGEIFTGADGKSWPLFSSPYRFSVELVAFPDPIGDLGEANSYVAYTCLT